MNLSQKQSVVQGNEQPLIECVPNFSEGRDPNVIDAIVDSIRSVNGVNVLNVDSGKSANRTVVTFVGTPEAVSEAAFRAVKKASECIDMSTQKGEHPRFGATDVLPLVPLRNISMEETVAYARTLGERIGNELGIPVYLYEYAAQHEERRNLAACRAGEYEGLPEKLKDPAWKPDFGPAAFTETVRKTGAIALGARNFLIAYNVNLNTDSVEIAREIAGEIREKGRPKPLNDASTGETIKDENGRTVYIPGLLQGVKAIGWYMEEYGCAQVSYNITDLQKASMHRVYELTCERAALHGVQVTGSELIGLVPLNVLLEAGRYFLNKQHSPTDALSEKELIDAAIRSMGLNQMKPFRGEEKIIEYLNTNYAN